MMSTARPRALLLVAATGLGLVLSACGGDDAAEGGAASTGSDASTAETSAAPVSDQPFGPGCASLPAEGEGSLAGMADDPLITAATNSQILSALVQAVAAASLTESLNGQQNITVLAPADTAFEAVPADVRDPLMSDLPRLTAVLTHHVIQGRLTPADLAGTHTTLSNDEVTIEGSGEGFSVSADQTLTGGAPASVICGNVTTANATVYILDQVLVPSV
ncbi:MAG: Secreted/surface protein with fasciclin-like repeat [Blastococcus sp.]|nr:Secreted/surface protein with fasciclin-like repeat [Blastococcus sp.]